MSDSGIVPIQSVVFHQKGFNRDIFTGKYGEITLDPNLLELFIHDGVTPGGRPLYSTLFAKVDQNITIINQAVAAKVDQDQAGQTFVPLVDNIVPIQYLPYLSNTGNVSLDGYLTGNTVVGAGLGLTGGGLLKNGITFQVASRGISNDMLAGVPNGTIKANLTNDGDSPADVTMNQLKNAMSLGMADIAGLPSTLAGMVSNTNLELLSKVDQTSLTGLLATKADMSTLSTKVDAAYVGSAIANLATVDSLRSGLSGKVDSNTFVSVIASKADLSALDTKANVSDLEPFVTKVDLANALSVKADIDYVSRSLSSKVDTAALTAALIYKANATDVAFALMNKADLSNGALLATQIPDLSSVYVTQAMLFNGQDRIISSLLPNVTVTNAVSVLHVADLVDAGSVGSDIVRSNSVASAKGLLALTSTDIGDSSALGRLMLCGNVVTTKQALGIDIDENTISVLFTSLANTDLTLSTLSNRIETVSAIMDSQVSKIATDEGILGQVTNAVPFLTANISALNAGLGLQAANLSALTVTVSSVTDATTALKANVGSLTTSLIATQSDVLGLQVNATSITNTVSILGASLGAQGMILGNVSTTVQGLFAQQSQTVGSLTALSNTVGTLSSTLFVQGNAISQLTTNVTGLQSGLSAVGSRLVSDLVQINALNSNVASMGSDLSSTDANVASLAILAANLSSNLTSKVWATDANVAILSTNALTLKARVDTHDVIIGGLTANVGTLTLGLSNANASLGILSANVSTLSNTLSGLQTRLTTDEANVAILQSNVMSLNSNLSTLITRLTADESNVSTIAANLSSVSNTVNSYATRFTLDETNIGMVNSNVVALGTSLASVSSRQSGDASNIAILQANIVSSTNRINSDAANIALLQANALALSNRLAADETTIANLAQYRTVEGIYACDVNGLVTIPISPSFTKLGSITALPFLNPVNGRLILASISSANTSQVVLALRQSITQTLGTTLSQIVGVTIDTVSIAPNASQVSVSITGWS